MSDVLRAPHDQSKTLSEHFVAIGHFQRNFDKVDRQRSTTKLGTSLSRQALVARACPRTVHSGRRQRQETLIFERPGVRWNDSLLSHMGQKTVVIARPTATLTCRSAAAFATQASLGSLIGLALRQTRLLAHGRSLERRGPRQPPGPA